MSDTVKIYVDEKMMEVPAGISVAAAILGHSHSHNHSNNQSRKAFHNNSMDASPRAPYCLMGVCFECMMEIDGEANVQSCLVTVQDGMQVKRQLNTEAFHYKNTEDDLPENRRTNND